MRGLLSLLSCISPLVAQSPQPTITGPYTLRLHDTEWRVLDEEAVYYVPTASLKKNADLPTPGRSLSTIIQRRGFTKPIPCRFIDFIDTTKLETPHHFQEDGGSRILDLPGGRFRVTSSPQGFQLVWFSFHIRTADRAGSPHLLVAELPNDRERYTTLTLTVPPGRSWSPPYRGQEKVKVDAMKLSQEPLWYEPDVGLCTYTGRDLPLNNQTFPVHFIFYPKTAQMKLTVSSSGWYQKFDPLNGAAISKIWVFEITGSLVDHLPQIASVPEKSQRHFGIYCTHPWYFLAHYGVPPHTPMQRKKSFSNLCDTLAFCGLNLIQFNAINGSDRAGRAWYPDSHYSTGGPNLLAELPPVAAKRDIDLIPVVTSITVPGKINVATPNKLGFSELSFQKPADPEADPRAFENRAPDPLRPEVQNWLIRQLVEIAQQSRDHPNIIGIGFRVNGKIGTCYISGEDKSGKQIRIIPASEVGYSSWNLTECRRDTGLNIPHDSLKAYHWLNADPKRWDQWLDFRCRRTRRFWLAARDAIQNIRSDWILYVLTDLPSEVLATNVLWPGPDDPNAEKITLDLLRSHGYDPRLFRHDQGIIVQRVMMVDMDRFFSKWGSPFGSNPLRYRDFHEQEFLARWYRSPSGSAVECYHNYWEEPFHPDGEFGSDRRGFGLRTATATAMDRAFFRPLTFTLRAANNDTLVLMGWQRPILGHEHDLRRFARALRSLPAASPRWLKTQPDHPRIRSGWYQDCMGIINDTPHPATVTVILDQFLPPGKHLKDIATGKRLLPLEAASPPRFQIELEAYDFHTLILESDL